MVTVKVLEAHIIEQQHGILKLLVNLVLNLLAIHLTWVWFIWLGRWFRRKDYANSLQLWVIFVQLFVKLLCCYPFFDEFYKFQYFGGLCESFNQFHNIRIGLIVFKHHHCIIQFLLNGLLTLDTKTFHLLRQLSPQMGHSDFELSCLSFTKHHFQSNYLLILYI